MASDESENIYFSLARNSRGGVTYIFLLLWRIARVIETGRVGRNRN